MNCRRLENHKRSVDEDTIKRLPICLYNINYKNTY